MVLNVVITTINHLLGNSGPFIAYFAMKLQKLKLFTSIPGPFRKYPFEMTVISKIKKLIPFATLFTISPSNFVLDVHNFCNVCPSFDFPVFLEEFQNLILILCPIFSLHILNDRFFWCLKNVLYNY